MERRVGIWVGAVYPEEEGDFAGTEEGSLFKCLTQRHSVDIKQLTWLKYICLIKPLKRNQGLPLIKVMF